MSASRQYQVNLSGAHRQLLKRWGKEAAKRGFLPSYVDELSAMDSHLKANPLHWGDPLFDMKHANWRIFRAISKRLIVHYAVDFDLKRVIVKDIQPLPTSGLSAPG